MHLVTTATDENEPARWACDNVSEIPIDWIRWMVFGWQRTSCQKRGRSNRLLQADEQSPHQRLEALGCQNARLGSAVLVQGITKRVIHFPQDLRTHDGFDPWDNVFPESRPDIGFSRSVRQIRRPIRTQEDLVVASVQQRLEIRQKLFERTVLLSA